MLFVFKNGWIAFLIVPIFFLGLLINLIVLSGLFLEVTCSKVLKLKVDFNKYAPLLKQILTATAILIVLALSISDLLDYITK